MMIYNDDNLYMMMMMMTGGGSVSWRPVTRVWVTRPVSSGSTCRTRQLSTSPRSALSVIKQTTVCIQILDNNDVC